MASILANWKTSLLGIGAILTAAGSIVTHLATGDTSTLGVGIAAILAGFGSLLGKDASAK